MNVHYKELADRAYYYHSGNQFDKAEEIYLQLLEINPDDANILNLLGTLYLAVKKYDNAVKYISKAFLLKNTSYLAANLAKAYFLNNQTDDAVKLYHTALNSGESDDIYYSLAIAYKKLNDIDKAVECYLKAINLNPDNYNALYNLALIYINKSDIDSAIYYINLCIGLKPKNDDLYALLSECYCCKDNNILGLELINKAISLNGSNYIYYYNSACLLTKCLFKFETDVYDYMMSCIDITDYNTYFTVYISFMLIRNSYQNEAVNDYRNSVKLNKKHINSYINMAKILYMQDKINDYIAVLSELITENPTNTQGHSWLAAAYLEIGEYEKALDCYNNAVKISGNSFSLLQGKAYALKNLGRIKEAKIILEKLNKVPNHNYISDISLGMIYLSEKNFLKGYDLYRNRNKDTKLYSVFQSGIWNKNINFEGKNVVLYSNCGFGDTIMYSRYINILKGKVNKLIIETDRELIDLLKKNFKEIEIIKKGIIPDNYDVVLPFTDIQYALDMDFDNIPKPRGYLKAEKTHFIKTDKKKIGLFWKGSGKIIKNRSISFELLKKLIQNDNCEFYSFQVDFEEDSINNLSQYINNFNDTASLLCEMDILITVDSAVVHLAGALGVKTFLMLPYIAEWRWFDDTYKTPWYDSVIIFKQDKLNEWISVIERIDKEIKKLCRQAMNI